MIEKRWKVSPEQLRALREIRINCQIGDCEYCPLESDEEYKICFLGDRLPERWNLERLEVESDG